MNTDVLIIGAGAAGLSAGAALAPHCHVVVLEQEAMPGHHATGRSAAIFVDGYGDAIVKQLSALSRPMFADPPFDHDGGALLSPRGLLHIVRAEAPDVPAEDPRAQLPRLTTTEARSLMPILRADAVRQAYHEERAADIDVHALLMGWQRQLRKHGDELRLSTPLHSARREAGIWIVETNNGPLRAPLVINAAGAWAEDVGAIFGAAVIGLQPLRRSAATIAPLQGQDPRRWPMVVDIEESLYFKPESGGLLVSPADETPCTPHDAFSEEIDIATGIARFEALTTVSVQRIASQWAGLRTFTPDRRPVLGHDPDVPGLFWLAGQGGFGIQTAFGMADLASRLITGRAIEGLEALVQAISPARFTGTAP